MVFIEFIWESLKKNGHSPCGQGVCEGKSMLLLLLRPGSLLSRSVGMLLLQQQHWYLKLSQPDKPLEACNHFRVLLFPWLKLRRWSQGSPSSAFLEVQSGQRGSHPRGGHPGRVSQRAAWEICSVRAGARFPFRIPVLARNHDYTHTGHFYSLSLFSL